MSNKNVIHKYIFNQEAFKNNLKIHNGFRVLHFGEDPHGRICMWCEVNVNRSLQDVKVSVVTTGKAVGS